MSVELIPVPVPASLDDDVDGLFRRTVEQRNLVAIEEYGHDDETMTPEANLPLWHDEYQHSALFLVVVDGRDAGRACFFATKEAGARTAELVVELAEWAERDDVRTSATDRLAELAREHERTVFQAWTVHHPGGGEMIAAPTGFGGVPADDPKARWFADRGWQLKQVERVSRFAFGDDDDIAARRASAEQAAGTEYRYVHWWGATPDERLGDMAVLHQRMSTDAPWGEMEYHEETWDVDRVRDYDARALESSDRLTGAIEHVPTGALVGFAELTHQRGEADDAITHQNDTLVLREHRGHRLGMLLKTANMQVWRPRYPRSPGIITYNAEENRPMLDVNEAVGFVPVNYIGAWQLDDPAAS